MEPFTRDGVAWQHIYCPLVRDRLPDYDQNDQLGQNIVEERSCHVAVNSALGVLLH